MGTEGHVHIFGHANSEYTSMVAFYDILNELIMPLFIKIALTQIKQIKINQLKLYCTLKLKTNILETTTHNLELNVIKQVIKYFYNSKNRWCG